MVNTMQFPLACGNSHWTQISFASESQRTPSGERWIHISLSGLLPGLLDCTVGLASFRGKYTTGHQAPVNHGFPNRGFDEYILWYVFVNFVIYRLINGIHLLIHAIILLIANIIRLTTY